MIPISFDISPIVSMYNLNLEQVKEFKRDILQRVSVAFVRNVRALAGSQLSQTRKEYLNSIVVKEEQSSSVLIELIGVLPNMVEQGASAFDMKRGFERSSKAVRKLGGGWYLTIPFRHAAPNSVGEASAFSGIMPENVYQVAKKLEFKAQLRAKDIPKTIQVGVRQAIKSDNRIFQEYKHKSTIYEGMQKVGVKGHTQYVTFRRVSDNSDVDSWIHSGIKEHDFFGKAIGKTNILYEVDLARDKFFSDIGI